MNIKLSIILPLRAISHITKSTDSYQTGIMSKRKKQLICMLLVGLVGLVGHHQISTIIVKIIKPRLTGPKEMTMKQH